MKNNRKFWLAIALFTLTVPGFILFSYWYLGIFSSMEISEISDQEFTIAGGEVVGDYNKTGAEVVKTRRLFLEAGRKCEPVLLYSNNAITTGKPYLRSVGGCVLSSALTADQQKLLGNEKIQIQQVKIARGLRLRTYGQTAVALRKSWTEIARLTEQGNELVFPLVQLVRDDGTNDLLIAVKRKKP